MIFTFQTPTIPGTGAPPLTPYSAPASTNTTPSLIGASFAGMSPLTGLANSRTESSIPLKKRTLTNESTSSGGGGGGGVGLSKQISNETNPSLESISLTDWQKHRVLALKQPSSSQQPQHQHRPHQRRRNPSSASHHHHYEDEDDAAFADDDSSAMFLDFYPAVIENTNGAFVTVTFAHNSSSAAAATATTAANAASAAPTHAHSAASADDPASSSLVLSQSLPNLSMLASQAYDYILLSLN